MLDPETYSDEEIIQRVHKDKWAFSTIVSRYEAKLKRYIRRIGVYQEQDAEDVLQNVFLKVYRNLNGFDPKLTFSSWVYRITHNEVINFFRKNKARPQGHYVNDPEDILQRIRDSGETSDQAEHNLDREQLITALERLNRKYKDVIILRYFEEREYKEISDILQIPTGSVGTLIHRAKKSLEKNLKHLR